MCEGGRNRGGGADGELGYRECKLIREITKHPCFIYFLKTGRDPAISETMGKGGCSIMVVAVVICFTFIFKKGFI
jgi:hypothetical protein